MVEKIETTSPKIIIKIDTERCKGCGLCVHFCPKSVLVLSGEFNSSGNHPVEVVAPESCTGCGYCYVICPDAALTILRNE